MADNPTLPPDGDGSQAPRSDELRFFWRDAPAQPGRQPFPWERATTPEEVEAYRVEQAAELAKAREEHKARQALLDAESDAVKIARLEAERTKAWERGSEHNVEQEKVALEKEKVKAGAVDKLPPQAKPSDINLILNGGDETTLTIDYLIDPWLPRKQVIGFYGRGESVKSSLVATLAAKVSDFASILWISTEEQKDWIKVRHTKCGGAALTMSVYDSMTVTRKDASGRALASSFNVYEHLDAAIQKAAATAESVHHDGSRPLRLVVLDTAVALTTWGKTENPSQDAAVKKLMAYLLMLAQKYDVCIVVIGHVNKGKHDHISDSVMGARAWVDSPRQSFLNAQDQREEYAFVTYAVKATLTGTFSATLRSEPVHVLYTRPDGSDSVLCRVAISDLVWGRQKSDDLWDAATKKPDEHGFDYGTGEPSTGVKRKYALMAQVMTTLVQMVKANTAPVTRESVEVALGVSVHNRDWKKIDAALGLQNIVGLAGSNHGALIYVQKQT